MKRFLICLAPFGYSVRGKLGFENEMKSWTDLMPASGHVMSFSQCVVLMNILATLDILNFCQNSLDILYWSNLSPRSLLTFGGPKLGS